MHKILKIICNAARAAYRYLKVKLQHGWSGKVARRIYVPKSVDSPRHYKLHVAYLTGASQLCLLAMEWNLGFSCFLSVENWQAIHSVKWFSRELKW